ncbi:MAG: hypothetical protein HC834_06980 [Rhodospirillales bacterium]|nr:hypothetical protein [Rhodospirillales bacterium]
MDAQRLRRAADVPALEGVQREAEVGARTVLDILNAEQELLTSEVDLVVPNATRSSRRIRSRPRSAT